MTGVRLALLALRHRRSVSALVLALATVAVAAAALGPLWSQAAQESLLRDRLSERPVAATGLAVSRDNTGKGSDPVQDLLGQSAAALRDDRLDGRFGPVRQGLRLVNDLQLLGGSGIGPAAVARLAWREGQCELLRFVEGRCPSALGEVALSARSTDVLGRTLGPLRTSLAVSAPVAPVVVGIYEPIDPEDPAWFSLPYFDAGPRPGDTAPPKLDTVFGSRPAVEALPAEDLVATSDRALITDEVTLRTVEELRDEVVALVRARGGDGLLVTTSLPAVLDGVAAERSDVATAALVVALQLLLLAVAVLHLVLTAATESRAGEVALARLRGARTGQSLATASLEPVLLLLLAAPLGLLTAWGAGQLLASAALRPGTSVALTWQVLAGVGVALLAGAGSAVLAGRRVLLLPVLRVLRADLTPIGRAKGVAAEVGVVVLAAAATWSLLDSGADSGLALLAPALVSLAVGLVGIRLVPLVASVVVRRTRGSGRTSVFLAVRQVARRPRLLRAVALVAIAVSLAVFAVNGWDVAGDNRQARAEQEVGAATVLSLRPTSVARLTAAVDAVDPGGRRALAALETVPGGQAGFDRLLAVDSRRLAAVSAWSPRWTGDTATQVARALRPSGADPVLLRGRQVEVDVEAGLTSVGGAARLALDLRVGVEDRRVVLGPLITGSATYRVALPAGCTDGCAVRRFLLDRSVSGRLAGEVLVRAVRVDGRPAEAALTSPGAWRGTRVELYDASTVIVPRAEAVPGGLRVRFDTQDSPAPVSWTPADVPAALPVVIGPQVRVDPYGGDDGLLLGPAPDGTLLLLDVVDRDAVLPRTGLSGALVDLVVLDRLSRGGTPAGFPQVWLAPGVDPVPLVAALEARGLSVVATETLLDRRSALDAEGPALALLLFLAAAGGALVLAVVAVSAVLLDAGRRRAPELSALRSLGVPRRMLARAALQEQLGLMGLGLALGAVAGVVALLVALPRLPVVAEASGRAPAVLDPDWALVAGVLLATAALIVPVAFVSTRLVVRAAGLGRRQ